MLPKQGKHSRECCLATEPVKSPPATLEQSHPPFKAARGESEPTMPRHPPPPGRPRVPGLPCRAARPGVRDRPCLCAEPTQTPPGPGWARSCEARPPRPPWRAGLPFEWDKRAQRGGCSAPLGGRPRTLQAPRVWVRTQGPSDGTHPRPQHRLCLFCVWFTVGVNGPLPGGDTRAPSGPLGPVPVHPNRAAPAHHPAGRGWVRVLLSGLRIRRGFVTQGGEVIGPLARMPTQTPHCGPLRPHQRRDLALELPPHGGGPFSTPSSWLPRPLGTA